MKKWNALILTLCLASSLVVNASALEYSIEAPGYPDYGKPTSFEPMVTVDGGAMKNEDISKNAALIPPSFGSASMDALNTGDFLTPNLAPGGMVGGGAVVNGGSSPIVIPGSPVQSLPSTSTTKPWTSYTEVTDDLYYNSGYLATLKIPAIDLSVRVYEGTSSSILSKGVGHFKETSIWDGNVALAAHNRGVNDYFGEIHNLDIGDKVTLTTKLGTRTYEVYSIEKVSETDRSGLAATADNQLTMYTCVRNQRDARWKVVAAAV